MKSHLIHTFVIGCFHVIENPEAVISDGSRTRAPTQCLFSFSCSFRQNLCQIIGWRPFPEIGAPPGNPGSSTGDDSKLQLTKLTNIWQPEIMSKPTHESNSGISFIHPHGVLGSTEVITLIFL